MGEGRGRQFLPALPRPAGFNSGFGLKDTWLSSLPRLQVGDGPKGTSPSVLLLRKPLLPTLCSRPGARPGPS